MELDSRFQKLWDIAKQYLRKGRKVDLPHTRVSLDFALRLLEQEGGQKRVVVPAVILHDIGYSAIQEANLYQKTTYFGVYKRGEEAGAYSVKLKQRHMHEGAKLARSILNSLHYDVDLLEEIVDIVETHEDLSSFPPSTTNINKIIVSDADKLFRVTAYNFFSVIEAHNASPEDVFNYFGDMKDKWFVTETARRIALEEMRKIPGSDAFPSLFT